MHKIQLTLTKEEIDLLAAKASQLGYSPTRYIKFLISREAANTVDILRDSGVPTYKMSKKAEKISKEAKKEYKQGKVKEISSFKELDK